MGQAEQNSSKSQGLKSALAEAAGWLRDYVNAFREGRVSPLSATERKCRAATRDEPWGPTGLQLNELAQMTYDEAEALHIFAVLEQRLMSPGERWRNVYKALRVLEFLVLRGHDRCPAMGALLLPLLRCLHNFAYITKHKEDVGANVRIRSAAVVALLEDMPGLWLQRQQLADRMRQHYLEWVALTPTQQAQHAQQDLADFQQVRDMVLSHRLVYEGMPSLTTSQPPTPSSTGSGTVVSVSGNRKAAVSAEESKRLKARLDALMARPDNKLCADCQAADAAARASWASVNCGVFICLSCAGIHRGLGVHVSQVRSVLLDTWLPSQVALMEAAGNGPANAYYEATLRPGLRPARDSPDMAAFIRDKYANKRWANPLGDWPPPITHTPAASPFAATTGRSSSGHSAGSRSHGRVLLGHSGSSSTGGACGALPQGARTWHSTTSTTTVSTTTRSTVAVPAGLTGTSGPSSETTTATPAHSVPSTPAAHAVACSTVSTGSQDSLVHSFNPSFEPEHTLAKPNANPGVLNSPKDAVSAASAASVVSEAASKGPELAQLLCLDDDEEEEGTNPSLSPSLSPSHHPSQPGGWAGLRIDPTLGVLEWLDTQQWAGGLPTGAILAGPVSPATPSSPYLPSPTGQPLHNHLNHHNHHLPTTGHLTHVILARPGSPAAWVPGYLPPKPSNPPTPAHTPLGSGAYPMGSSMQAVLTSQYHASHGNHPFMGGGLSGSYTGGFGHLVVNPSLDISCALDELAACTSSSSFITTGSCSSIITAATSTTAISGRPGAGPSSGGSQTSGHFALRPASQTSTSRGPPAYGSSTTASQQQQQQQQASAVGDVTAHSDRGAGNVLDTFPPSVPPADPIRFRGDDPFRASVIPFHPPHHQHHHQKSPFNSASHPASLVMDASRDSHATQAVASSATLQHQPGSTLALTPAGSGVGFIGFAAPSLAGTETGVRNHSLEDLLQGHLGSLDLSLQHPTTPHPGVPTTAANTVTGVPANPQVVMQARNRLAAAGIVKPASLPAVSSPLNGGSSNGAVGSMGGGHCQPEGALVSAMAKGRWLA